MEEFFCKTKLYSGAGAVEALKLWRSRRLFVVTDALFLRNGRAKAVADVTGADAVEYFPRKEPGISVALAAEGAKRLLEFSPDLVVALGGGSTLGLAKAMVYFSKSEVPLVAISTLSGSGAEVTDSVLLRHRQKSYPLKDPRMLPEAAILDSDFLRFLPKPLIAAGGFTILTHALEGYVSKNAGAMTSLLSREAFHMAYAYLPASYNGQQDARLPVHRAATLASLACCQAGQGLCQAMSGALNQAFPLSPGVANAILLPSVIACNAHCAGDKYARLARSAGICGSTDPVAVRNLHSGLIRLRRQLELPQTLRQAGIPIRQIWNRTGEIVSNTLASPWCQTNPTPVEDFLVRRLLEEISGHD